MKRLLFLGFVLVLIISGREFFTIFQSGCFSEKGMQDGHNGNLCFTLNFSYFLLVNVILIVFASLIAFTSFFSKRANFFKLFLVFVFSLSVSLFLYRENILYFSKEVQNYGYEYATIVFYQFFILSIILVFFSLLFQTFRRTIFLAYLGLIAIFSILLAYFGREGGEHYYLLIDYSLKDIAYLHLLIFAFGLLFLFIVIEALSHWVKTGKIKLFNGYKFVILTIFSSLLIFSSILVAKLLKHQDVKQAKNYAEKLIATINQYYQETGKYPKELDVQADKPFLLKNMDYLANMENSYYFSNPSKFCLIIFETGKNNKYHSITSNRGWHKSHFNKELKENFMEICDETSQDFFQKAVENHLGVPAQDDYSDKILHEAFGAKFRPQSNLISSQELEKEIRKMGLQTDNNADLNQEPLPAKNTQELKEYLKVLPKFKALQQRAANGEKIDPKEISEDKELMEYIDKISKPNSENK